MLTATFLAQQQTQRIVFNGSAFNIHYTVDSNTCRSTKQMKFIFFLSMTAMFKQTGHTIMYLATRTFYFPHQSAPSTERWPMRYILIIQTHLQYSWQLIGRSGIISDIHERGAWLKFQAERGSWSFSVPLGKCLNRTLNCQQAKAAL